MEFLKDINLIKKQKRKNKKYKLKFCICFFGVLSRSLDLTLKSINDNIFNVLSDNNIKIDLFVHDMKVKKVQERDSKEKNTITDKYYLLKSLNYNNLFYDSTIQEDFDIDFDWFVSMTIKYGSIFDYTTQQNAIRQLYSLKKVTQ